MSENTFEKLKTIAADEFGVNLIKTEDSETSKVLLDELREQLEIASEKSRI